MSHKCNIDVRSRLDSHSWWMLWSYCSKVTIIIMLSAKITVNDSFSMEFEKWDILQNEVHQTHKSQTVLALPRDCRLVSGYGRCGSHQSPGALALFTGGLVCRTKASSQWGTETEAQWWLPCPSFLLSSDNSATWYQLRPAALQRTTSLPMNEKIVCDVTGQGTTNSGWTAA